MTGKPVKEILTVGSVNYTQKTTGHTHGKTSGNLERDGQSKGGEKLSPDLVSGHLKPYHPASTNESGRVRKECFQCPSRCGLVHSQKAEMYDKTSH